IATGAASSGPSAGTKTSVSSWAFAPYASHHARWNAQRENGVAQGFRATRASQVAASRVSNARLTARSVRGLAVGARSSPTAGGQGGSPVGAEGDIDPRIAPERRNGC